MKEKIKVYIYTRVSTVMQTDGYSLDAQKEKLKAFAKYNDFIIAGEYEDAGKSGKSIEGRPQFLQMMKDIKNGNDHVGYVLVFKLSRFARNAADVLSTLQIMQDYGVNLICVEDGIDSSKDAGKLMISVLSAVAEIERENIRVQTMEGRIQKAREGKWNGGQAPYGYELHEGVLVIKPEEAAAVKLIFDKYVESPFSGVNNIARYLKAQGIRKNTRSNNKSNVFLECSITKILKNPVYTGKIAYGRTKQEHIPGTRNTRRVKQKEYLLVQGLHDPIISEELFEKAQAKLIKNTDKHKRITPTENFKVHLLTGILKCPICGEGMYSNVSVKNCKRKKDGSRYKDFHYYHCKHQGFLSSGEKCNYKKQINEELLDNAVEEIIVKLVTRPEFAKMLEERIQVKLDIGPLMDEISNYQHELKKTERTKAKIISEMDDLDPNEKHYERKKKDLDTRLDNIYDKLDELELKLATSIAKKDTIEKDKITSDNVYKILICLDHLYKVMSDRERREFISALVSDIQIYEEKQYNGQWLKSITFKLPIISEKLGLNGVEHVESVVLMSRVEGK